MKQRLMLLATALLVACSSTSGNLDSGTDGSPRVGIDQLGRMPLPVGTKIRGADSLIFGVGDNWLGRAVLEVPTDASSTYNFFADQFPRQNWTLVAAMRGKKSLLVFTRGDRSATIELEEAGLLSQVTAVITVSPAPANASGNNAPSGAGVVVQPIGQPRRP